MPRSMSPLDLLIPRRSEYVRGSVKPENLLKLAAVLAGGKDRWPFDAPIIARKLEKPVKRGGREYQYAVVDGVHRTLLALHSLGKMKLDALKGKGFDLPKLAEVPVEVKNLTAVEAEVEQLDANLRHGLLLDKKHRDAWVRHLLTVRKVKPEWLAKRLHMTERSIYRMRAGTQTIARPRAASKKPARRAAGAAPRAASGVNVPRVAPADWTPESWLDRLGALAVEGRRHKAKLAEYLQAHAKALGGWLPDLTEMLAPVASAQKE